MAIFSNGQMHAYGLPESPSGEVHQGLGQQAPEGLLRHGRLQVLPSATLAACRVDGVLACDRSGQLVFVQGGAVQACMEGAGMEAIGRLDSRGLGASFVSGCDGWHCRLLHNTHKHAEMLESTLYIAKYIHVSSSVLSAPCAGSQRAAPTRQSRRHMPQGVRLSSQPPPRKTPQTPPPRSLSWLPSRMCWGPCGALRWCPSQAPPCRQASV